MCPIFVGSQLSCLARYQKILKEYSFECKNLLNFTCHTMKFHNCHHPSHHHALSNHEKHVPLESPRKLPFNGWIDDTIWIQVRSTVMPPSCIVISWHCSTFYKLVKLSSKIYALLSVGTSKRLFFYCILFKIQFAEWFY